MLKKWSAWDKIPPRRLVAKNQHLRALSVVKRSAFFGEELYGTQSITYSENSIPLNLRTLEDVGQSPHETVVLPTCVSARVTLFTCHVGCHVHGGVAKMQREPPGARCGKKPHAGSGTTVCLATSTCKSQLNLWYLRISSIITDLSASERTCKSVIQADPAHVS